MLTRIAPTYTPPHASTHLSTLLYYTLSHISTLLHTRAHSCRAVGTTVHDGGCYVNIEGPTFGTIAESNLYRAWGANVSVCDEYRDNVLHLRCFVLPSLADLAPRAFLTLSGFPPQVVGMTTLPEARLCMEAEISYAVMVRCWRCALPSHGGLTPQLSAFVRLRSDLPYDFSPRTFFPRTRSPMQQ